MKKLVHLRLAIVLLNAQHAVKAMALVEGQPRYALRKAIEESLRLIAQANLAEPTRLAILPCGHGTLAKASERAVDYSKAGLTLSGPSGQEVREMGRRAAFVAWCGLLAEQERVARARPVAGTRLA